MSTFFEKRLFRRLLRDTLYDIGLDVHKKAISYRVKDAAGHVRRECKIGSTRRELHAWIRTLPHQPTTENYFITRADHAFSDKDRLSFSCFYDNTQQTLPASSRIC